MGDLEGRGEVEEETGGDYVSIYHEPRPQQSVKVPPG